MAKIDEITQRPVEYLNETGVPLLASGLVFVVLGVSQLLWPILVTHMAHPNLALVVQWAGVGCAALAMFAAVQMKRRFVFPRGGYVVPRQSPSIRILAPLAFSGIFLIWLFARG